MTSALTIPSTSVVLADSDQEAVSRALEDAHSPSTRRAYSASWAVFTEWCGSRGYPAHPPETDQIAAYQ